MRHGKKNNHLGRSKSHREAMLSNMACSLIEHKRINTTLAKAKALRVFIEPIITKSKQDITHNRRLAFKKLRNKDAVTELFKHVASKVADRKGGYTRVIKLGFRLGDAAEMAMIELVDYNMIYSSKKADDSTSKTKSTRTRRRGRKQKHSSELVEQKTEDTENKNDVSSGSSLSSTEDKINKDDTLKQEDSAMDDKS